jgi:hypothetical protein
MNNKCPYCYGELDTGGNCYKEECIAKRNYEQNIKPINVTKIYTEAETKIIELLEKILDKLEEVYMEI